jgi:ubiquinone/menaquinone biosynthesis C-methylase UbiE
MVEVTASDSTDYILGHNPDEIERLIDQQRFFGDLTAELFRRAGLTEGMRVLDLGCGAGDVSFLAASFVGPTGTVIGVDRSAEAIQVAEQRARHAGLSNIRFIAQDLSELTLEEPIDAIVGRLILMYLVDPAVIVRKLVSVLRPGGLVIFHEFDVDAAKSEPPCPVFDRAVERIKQTFNQAGVDRRMGLRLASVYREAGLPEPQMIMGARIEHGPDSQIYSQVSGVTRSLLPLMERLGIATPEEIDIGTLATRMSDEAVALGATLVTPAFVGAWARITHPS